VRTLLRNLLQVHGEVERVMQHERARTVVPAHEATADRSHVDQRERVQQPLASLYSGAAEMPVADRDPVVV
jgi:hypothetical protein